MDFEGRDLKESNVEPGDLVLMVFREGSIEGVTVSRFGEYLTSDSGKVNYFRPLDRESFSAYVHDCSERGVNLEKIDSREVSADKVYVISKSGGKSRETDFFKVLREDYLLAEGLYMTTIRPSWFKD